MGNKPSKSDSVSQTTTASSRSEESLNEKYAYNAAADKGNKSQLADYVHLLGGLKITDEDEEGEVPPGNPLSNNVYSNWQSSFTADKRMLLAQSALAHNTIESVVAKSDLETVVKDQYLFNVTVDTIGSPSFFNNQKSSGRCWIFASSNVFRTHVIKNYNLSPDKFQVSQSYLFFYDKLEKAYFFLENIIDTFEDELDSRLIHYLLQSPVGDGGQWDMIVNLVNKYGLVPQEFFPDNAQAISSSALNYILTEKLREFALILRSMLKEGASLPAVGLVKFVMIAVIYNIISVALGTPPTADTPFTWEFIDKDGNYKSFETTPLNFYKDHVRFNAEQNFSLIHDPRNDYDKLYTVDRLNNISGGKPIEYVNTEIDDIKKVAIKMLKDNEPIFFGSDVGKFGNRVTGILDTTAYDYELAFGVGLDIQKADRLKTGSSQMTHAMVITGVHLDPKTGKPIRWKIENSWGDEVGEKGYFMMTDEWFNEYVFQIVTSKKYATKKSYEVWKSKDYVVLPYYDPMGALA
ncbi:aminopeptidase and bleomycin hydrolase [Scheffersomyces coipomensis]|uniref:aminopeptidase and bleomycin hydrolase n=1 Tax=Scheffersomyces coipomensis TaxID=1788519 RepID=UPI00315DBDF1